MRRENSFVARFEIIPVIDGMSNIAIICSDVNRMYQRANMQFGIFWETKSTKTNDRITTAIDAILIPHIKLSQPTSC